jgi:DNA polymerase-4
MHEMGIYKGEDLYEKSEMDLIREFGKMGYSLYRKVRGIHDSPVEPNRDRKSVGRENTFSKPLLVEDQVVIELRELAKDVEKSLKRAQLHGQTVVLKVRDKEYETFTKRVTIRDYIDDDETIYFYAKQIWDTFDLLERGIRLLGITVTNLESKQYELIKLPLWEKEQPTKKPEE